MKPYNPYLDMLLWPTPDAAAIAKEAGLKAMTLAFLVADPEGTALCWGGQPTYPVDWMQSQAKALAKAGVAFDVSIGGATGQDIAAGKNAQVAADAYAKAWRELRPRYLDFDIEGAAVMDTPTAPSPPRGAGHRQRTGGGRRAAGNPLHNDAGSNAGRPTRAGARPG